MDSSQSSDHRSVSEIMSSEPEVAKVGPDAAGILTRPQLHVVDSGPVSTTGFGFHKTADVTVDDAIKPLPSGKEQLATSMKSPKSHEVSEQPVDVSLLAQTVVPNTRLETAVIESNTVRENCGNEMYTEKNGCDLVRADSLNDMPLLNAVNSRNDREKSDSESTPKNERPVQQDDISVSLDETLSENPTSSTLSSQNGTKPSPVCGKRQLTVAEQQNLEKPDAEAKLREASAKSAAGDAQRSVEDNKDLTHLPGEVMTSSHLASSPQDIQSADNRSLRSRSASSRHSASGASRVVTDKASAVDSSRSEGADDISNGSDVSSKASVDYSSYSSNGLNKVDDFDRQVSGRAASVESKSASRSDSVHSISCRSDTVDSNISSRTYPVNSANTVSDRSHGSGKTPHTASLKRSADIAVPDNAGHRTGSTGSKVEEQLESTDAADTDEDVADIEADQSLHLKATEKVPGIVSDTSPAVHPARQEFGLNDDAVNLRDEHPPDELDNDSDIAEDRHSSVRSGSDVKSLPRSASRPQTDTSESRAGRKSEDLHSIIRKVAVAVESFAADNETTSAMIDNAGNEPISDDRCKKASDGAAKSLLTDAIDQMLAVRKHKRAVESDVSTVPAPAMPLSPSAPGDSAASTASTSSDGQVKLDFLSTVAIH